MALGSQQGRVEAMSALTGLTHDIFVGKVVRNVIRESKVGMLFTEALPQGDYRLEGQNMKFATDLRYATGAMATSGKIPDHVGLDAVQGSITPVRRYRRIALDNLVEKRASGPGAFDNLSDRIFDILWDSWKSMEIRHAIGDTSGILCTVSARSSNTVWTANAGYNSSGTNPISHISEGSILGWYDTSATAVGGVGVVSSINYSTNVVTMAASWEQGGNAIATDGTDFVYFATTSTYTADYMELERNLAPNGAGTLLDPTAASTTVHGISQSTYQRWKPYRKASATFDHLEVTEHWLQLGQKRGIDVSPETDVAVAHPGAIAQLARSLMGLQQQVYSGTSLAGGYSQVTVSGVPFVQDGFWYANVMGTFHKPALFRVNLGGDADFWGEDGSQWSRIADFDGKEAYVVDYMNYFSPNRGAHSALTGITTPDVTEADFDTVPNY